MDEDEFIGIISIWIKWFV